MSILIGLAILALLGFSIWDRNRTTYPYSKTGKPYVERDSDGYLTLESYQSHIAFHGNGATEVDTFAIVNSRSFHEAHQWFQANKNKDGVVIIND